MAHVAHADYFIIISQSFGRNMILVFILIKNAILLLIMQISPRQNRRKITEALYNEDSKFIYTSQFWLAAFRVSQTKKEKKKNCPSCGSLKEGQLKCNGKQINLMMAYRTDRQLTWENENRVSLYLIMLSRLIVKTALASVISRLSDFRGVIIQWCLTHPNRKSSLFPQLNR